MENLIPLFAIVGTFSSIIVFLYLFFNSRHKIRMALIQHGKDASIFSQGRNTMSALKYGLVAVGIGLGIFTGAILDRSNVMDEGPAYFGMMLILGGFGLLLYYFLVKNKTDNSDTV